MRFTEIYHRCKASQRILEGIVLINRNDGIYHIQNINIARDALKLIDGVEFLKNEFTEFVNLHNELASDMRLSRYDVETLRRFDKARLALLNKLQLVINMFESTGMDGTEYIGLDIKIPVSGNFSDFRKYIDDLDFLFTKCPFFQSENESLRFKNVDIGSVWLTFAVIGTSIVAGSMLLNNIAAFIDKCLTIRSHYLTTQKQALDIEKASKSQEQRDRLLENLNEIYRIQVDSVIKDLEELTGHRIEDGDEYGRVKLCIERLNTLFESGLEIYASINSPEETKALFAPLEMKYISVNSQIKTLEQGSDDPDSE